MKIVFSEAPAVGAKTYSRKITVINIHNTETDETQSLSDAVKRISESHEKRFKKGGQKESCVGTDIGYHYLIGADGTVVQTRCIDEIGFHNSKNNSTSIGIALVGNFNIVKPTKEQYENLNILLQILKQQFPEAKIQPHRSWGSTCPGKNFDPEKAGIIVDKNKPRLVKKSSSITGYYNITRYYSPIKGQSRYYKGKSYEADVTMNCGTSNIGNDGCLYPAYGGILTNEEAGYVVACGQQFPAYTKFKIEGYGWVTCKDRGGAIVGRDLDLRMGVGEVGLNAIEKTKWPAGDHVLISEVLFPNSK